MKTEAETDILRELRAITERLARIESVLDRLQKKLGDKDALSSEYEDEVDRRLAAVAEKLLDDYLHDEELTIFTTHGADEFYEEE